MGRVFCFLMGICLTSPCFSSENKKTALISDLAIPDSQPNEPINESQPLDVSVQDEQLGYISSIAQTTPFIHNSDISLEELLLLKEMSVSTEVLSSMMRPNRSISSVNEVSEKTRLKHAKELLGHRKFKKSSIAKQLDSDSFKRDVLKSIKSRLTGKNKKYANKIMKTIFATSKKYSFDPIFIEAVIQTESSFDPSAKGSAGEIGLMQLMPETALWIAQKEGILEYKNKKSLENPTTNIKLGVAYMAFLRDYFKKNPTRYIAAYNMGANNVKKLIAQSRKPKTYPIRVLKNYSLLYAGLNGEE